MRVLDFNENDADPRWAVSPGQKRWDPNAVRPPTGDVYEREAKARDVISWLILGAMFLTGVSFLVAGFLVNLSHAG